VYPHSTVQPTVQQYRERSPNPYVGMKEEGEGNTELYRNEPTILAGNLEDCVYNIEESTCASQPMIGTSEDGLMVPCLKLSYSPLPRRQPWGPVPPHPFIVLVA
jgi:hypothetical protein